MSRSTPPDTGRESDGSDEERAEALTDDIRQTREQLGETVSALVHAVNVPERAKAKMSQAGHTALHKADAAVAALPAPVEQGVHRGVAVVRAHPVPILASLAAALVLLRILVGRRS